MKWEKVQTFMLQTTPSEVTEPDATHPLVLIVDSDAGFAQAVSSYLRSNDYRVETAGDKPAMRAVLENRAVGLVVLGSLGPGEDSVSVCQALARPGGPAIVMLSPLTDVTDRIIALELGADVFLPRACSPRELLARLRAIFRRRRAFSDRPSTARWQFSGWRLDLLRRQLLSPAGVLVKLTAKEFVLLCAFIENPHQMLSRDFLTARTGDPGRAIYQRAVAVQISRLRQKLSQGGRSPDLIRTLRGKGYVFNSTIHAG